MQGQGGSMYIVLPLNIYKEDVSVTQTLVSQVAKEQSYRCIKGRPLVNTTKNIYKQTILSLDYSLHIPPSTFDPTKCINSVPIFVLIMKRQIPTAIYINMNTYKSWQAQKQHKIHARKH